jgi:hypothetical protein
MSSQAIGQRIMVTFSSVAYNGQALPKAVHFNGFWQCGVSGSAFQPFVHLGI